MQTFLQSLRTTVCLQTEKPVVTVDPVTLVTDTDGRVFSTTGSKVKINWCGFQAQGTGKIEARLQVKDTPSWGFRFRPKFISSVLFLDAMHDIGTSFNLGLGLDFFFIQRWNLTASLGYRATHLDLGFDLTKNFGVTAGVGFSFFSLHTTPTLGVYFSF